MRGICVVQVMEVMEVASVPARTLREGWVSDER
jgi:hypothetical protein